MTKIVFFRKFAVLWLMSFVIACTGNPFDDSQEISNVNTITGTIRLSDAAAPANVFVWLESLEISTFTDANGNFSLTLPPSGQQGGGSLTGAFDLYFYMANYQVSTAEIALQNGVLLTNQGDVNANGALTEMQTLPKLLDVEIRTEFTPVVPFKNADNIVTLRTTLRAVGGSAVEVLSFGNDSGNEFLSVVFLRRLQNSVPGPPSAVFANPNNTSRTIGPDAQEFIAQIRFPSCTLEAGTYQVRPFLWVRQPALPNRLIEALGNVPETLTLNFDNIPFTDLRYVGFTIGPERPPDDNGLPRPCP